VDNYALPSRGFESRQHEHHHSIFYCKEALCRWGEKYVKMLFSTAIKYGANGLMKRFLAPEESKFKLKYVDNCLSMCSFSQKINDSGGQSLSTNICNIKNAFTD